MGETLEQYYQSLGLSPKVYRFCKAVEKELGEGSAVVLDKPMSFSEDFSYYGNATGTPSLFLLLNAGYLGDAPHSLHDARCTFQEEALECGVAAMCATALKILEA